MWFFGIFPAQIDACLKAKSRKDGGLFCGEKLEIEINRYDVARLMKRMRF
jgi:hypothetical protein